MRTKLTLLALLSVSVSVGVSAQDPEVAAPSPMQAPAVMEAAAAPAPAPMEAAVMEAAPAPVAMTSGVTPPGSMAAIDPAVLAARRERIREAREAARAAQAAEAQAAEAQAAEGQAPEGAIDEADSVALGSSEDELEAMAAEENLEGEDYAEEIEPAAAMQEDADLLERIEETDFAEAHEAMHGEGQVVTPDAILSSRLFLSSVLTFLVLVFLFWFFLFKKGRAVPTALAARRREIEEHLAEAQRLKAEAEAKKAEYTERLEALDSQLESLRAEMVRAGEAERDRIVSEAESKAAAMRRDVDFTIEQRMKQLRDELTAEMASSAVAAAEEVLRAETRPADQQRLADSYLSSLSHVTGDSPRSTPTKETQA